MSPFMESSIEAASIARLLLFSVTLFRPCLGKVSIEVSVEMATTAQHGRMEKSEEPISIA